MDLKESFETAKCLSCFCAPFVALGIAAVTILPPVVDAGVDEFIRIVHGVGEGFDYAGKAIDQRTFDPY